MKKKITFLIAAAVMLLTMMASTGTMLGQSDYSTTYTSNITLPTSGTQASSCVVVIGGTNYDGTKLGKSNAGGSASITAPAGTKYIHLHVAAWKAKSPGFTYTVGSGTAQTITGITSNDGISNNSPFTFSGDASSTNYYKVITLSSALTEATSITFASTSERVVFWGVNTEEEGSGDDPSISAENVEIAYDADYGEIEYTINNPVEYGWIDPSTTADWLTFGNVEDDKVNFVCDHNPNATARTATVTLTYNYNAKATVTKNVTVTQAGDPNGSGSEANPYTVAQARAAIDANSGVTDVYATGIVSEIPTAWNSTYSNITFNFVDNSGDTDFLQAYRCGSGTGVDASEVAVGDIVVVYGNLTKYSSTYEFAQGCTLVSLEHPAVSVEAPTFDPEPGTYEFQVDVTMDCETDGVAIYYTMDGTTPTENSTLFEGDEISVEETTTFKAIAIKGTESSNVTTATYHINSANNPYTVAQALAFLDYPTSTIFVHGIVSTAPAQAPTNNGQMTYYISDNGEATNQLEVYKGKGLNQAAFSAQTDIQVGDIVTITGIVKVYNSTIEFDTDNYLVSFERPAVPSITLPQYEFSLNADGGDAEIPITYTNLAADPQLGVMFCDATGAEYQYSWISGTVSNSTLYGHIDENEGEARTAYFKIKGLDADNNEVYSDLVTINQAASAGAIITFNTTTYTLMAGGESKTISFEYEGLGNNPTFSVNFYSATGEPTQYDWITAEVQTDDNKVDVNVVANEGEARTAYFKVSGVNGAVNAESNLVTINQEAGGTPSTSFTWDLSIASYDEITDPDIVTWSSNYAIMTNSSKSGGTSASNYLGGDSNNRTSSRFYNGNTLTITPVAGYAITSLVFTATSHNYAAALQGSTWTNATATMEEGDNVKDVTITPTDGTSVITAAITGTCGFTAVTVNYVANSNPTINANDVSIAYDATEGMIEYTIINPVEGASLEAVPTHGGDVFIMGEAANGVVPFTCSVNEQATERTATVELRYTYNRATITKEVIITQAGNPAVISNISNITATGDYTVQGTVVAISNRGFILGDGTGYAYYYKGSGFTPGDYNIGDIKKMSGTVGTFNNVYQFPDGTTITDATDSNYNNTPEVQVLDATGIAAYSTNNHLSDYVQFEGTLVKSGNYYNVQVADLATDASISFPTSAQTTALDALENKTIVVKGYFAGVSGGHFGVILESAEETTTPNISVTPDEINVDAAEHEGTLTITVSNLTIDDPNTDLGIQFYDGNGTEIENPTWIALDDFEVSGENFTVYYVIGENEGELRQAFLKVYSMDANTEFIYSNLVSINQAAPVTPPTGDEYDLYSGDLVEGDYIIYYDGSAMKNTIDSGRLYYETVSPENNSIITSDATIVWHIAPNGEYWNIYNADVQKYAAGTGVKNKAQLLDDGDDDKSLWTVSGTNTYDFVNKANAAANVNAYLRNNKDANNNYGFACYASSTGGALSLYKKVVDPTAATIAVSPSTVNAPAAATNGTLTVTYHNINMNTVDIQWTSEEPNWVTLTFDNNNNVEYTIFENIDTEARTASFKVTGQNDDTNEDVYSNEITINQAGYVIDYVELPFGFDGGKADIENTVGLTQYDLDSDYNASPKLKFKNTGSWVVLKFDGVLKSLSYDIKGNSFSGGTFDVELSADGVDYTSIATYTELGATQTVTLIVDNENARYVRWIYTEKVGGNVALGNIYASDTYDIYGEVTMGDLDASVTPCIVVEGGVITVTGTITTNSPDDIMIYEGGQFIANSDFQATLQKQTTHASSWKDRGVDGWYLIASPVDNYATSPEIAFGNYDLFAYSEPDATWYVDHEVWGQPAAHPFTTLERGIGYLYANAADRDMYIAGDMKATDTKIEKDVTTDCAYDDLRGFNLMGNPFTRNLTADDMKIGETTVATVYVANGGDDYITLNLAGGDQIKPGQGFMLQTEVAGKLTFNPDSKDAGNIGFVSIVAGNETSTDKAYIQVGNVTTLRKIGLSEDNTKVYVMNNGKDYAAARVDELIGSMPVCFKAAADGEYTITIEAQNIEVDHMHLIDNFTGEDVDLLLEPSYTFTANVGDIETRFRLDFGMNGVNEVSENNVFAYQHGDEIIVSGNGELQVFDVMGRMVMNTKINGVQSIAMPQGVYVFRMNNNIQKIVVR